MVKKGNAEPKIKDFIVTDFSGNDSTEMLLRQNGYTFLFMVNNVGKAGKGWREKMQHLQMDCAQYGIKLYGITSSSLAEANRFREENDLHFPFLQMDGTVIKTAARSNPCLILLKQGTVEGKWHYHDMPAGAVPSPDRQKINLKF